MKRRNIAFLLIALTVLAGSVLSHGGGLDSLGCHNDRKRGGYHCHRGELAGKSFSSKAAAQQELSKRRAKTQAKSEQQPRQTSATAEDNEERTVYVTKSGKKFHGEKCSYLKSSKIPISLKDAQEKGYTACSKCSGR